MTHKQTPWLLFLLLALAALWPLSVRPASAASKHIVVIMAASTAVGDISSAVLRRAFLGEAAELGGKRLVPLNHPPGTPARNTFDRAVLGLSPEQTGAFWIDRRIRAESAPPRAVPSPELATRIVASLPGAITYSTPEHVTAQVKILSIDGKAPGAAGYPLNY
jgi:hypothetical protein